MATSDEISDEGDPGNWGASLLNVFELLRACLDARQARSVLEVGAHVGDLTRELLAWASEHDAKVAAIDPEPPKPLLALKRERPELELIERTSHEALREVELADAIVIDGDHNYFTVREELRLIAERTGDGELPLLLFHDVGWPHARRDSYYVPDRIPDGDRHEISERGGIIPSDPGIVPGGLPLPCAVHEGGPRNGVLTAIEDFVAELPNVRLATLPIFFGFGAVWDERSSWAGAVAAALDPWDRNPVLERLEANRVYHLAFGHQMYSRLGALTLEVEQQRESIEALTAQLERQRTLLNALGDSGAFALAERLSKLRQGGEPAFSREQIKRLLAEGG